MLSQGMPYAGLTVINASRGVAGATAAQLLAGLGARVIRVEEPGADQSPSRGVLAGWDSNGDLFEHFGRGSESGVLDLSSESGVAGLTRLAERADIVIDDERPGDERGTRGAIRKARARSAEFTHASITPFGLSGPWIDVPSSSMIVFAASGLMNFVGEPDREPLRLPSWLVDSHVGLAAFTAITSTIRIDGGSMTSCDLDIAAMDVLANCNPHAISQTSYTGIVGRRQGSRFVDGYPWTVLECKDGDIGIIVPQTGWDVFCLWMERPDLIEDPRFADRFRRRQHADELDVILTAWTQTLTRDELYREGQDRHLPFGAVFTVADSLDSPQLAARDFFDTAPNGRTRLAGLPFAFNEARPHVAAAPSLGEHTETVTKEFSLDRVEVSTP